MSQALQDKPHREARPGQNPRAKKQNALRALLPKLAVELAKEPPATAKTSAAYVALLPQATIILGALKRGYTANAIATLIAEQAEAGRHAKTFSIETLRNAVKRIEQEAKDGKKFHAPFDQKQSEETSRTERISALTETSTHAGFEEDPT